MDIEEGDIKIVIFSCAGVGKSTIAGLIEDALSDIGINVTNCDADEEVSSDMHVNKIIAMKKKGVKVTIATCCCMKGPKT